MTPTIGHTVHYLDGEGITRAAIVTHVYDPPVTDDDGTERATVDPSYFTRIGTTVKPARLVVEGTGEGEWSWPPRA